MKKSSARPGLFLGQWLKNHHSIPAAGGSGFKLSSGGATFIELAMAVAMIGSLVGAVLLARSMTAKMTERSQEKAFATQKAVQMVEELRSVASASVSNLDNFGDGSKYNSILTTDKSVSLGSDPESGNIAIGGGWKYWRQVEVAALPQDPFGRIVNVTVYRSDTFDPTKPSVLLAQTSTIMRTVTSITPPSQVLDVYCLALSNIVGWFTEMPLMAPAFQQAVNDLQLRNPGLVIHSHFITQSGYGRDPLYQPFINVQRNASTSSSAISWVYFYPGKMTQTSGAGVQDSFFSDTQLQQDGNIMDDKSSSRSRLASFYPTNWGYSVCDMYNHNMRYPDELAMYQAVSTYQASTGQIPPEITLRMLLEGMNSQPTSFQNAIIVSMHGEVIPLPAFRNWSDPAKDPSGGLTFNTPGFLWPRSGGNFVNPMNMRAVVHPTLIHYKTGSSGITLRAYAYYDGVDWSTTGPVTTGAVTTGNGASGAVTTLDQACPTGMGVNNYMPVMTVYIRGVTLTAGTGSGQISVNCIYGGISSFTGLTVPYGTAVNLAPATADPGGMNMSWNIGTVPTAVGQPGSGGTTLQFYNTPLRSPEVGSSGTTDQGGLPAANQLYETEYISCPVSAFGSVASIFSPDLTSTAKGPKNTARWVIMINNSGSPAPLSDGQYEIDTRLGTDLLTGTTTEGENEAPNLSKTYVWMGGGPVSSLGTSSCGITPWTEQQQTIGDPRDCPYADIKFGSTALGTNDAYVNISANSYNWYFKKLSGTPDSDGYSGFGSASNNGYEAYQDHRDMPKFYWLYRRGLLTQGAIYCNLNGYTAWHADMGGEMGDTYDPFGASLNFASGVPWMPHNPTSNVNVDEIQTSNDFLSNGSQSARGIAKAVDNSNGFTLGSQWYAKFWRGELYPDDWFGTWLSNGNLPVGDGNFFREFLGSMTPPSASTKLNDGFEQNDQYQWGVGQNGPDAFINGLAGTSGSATYGFMHSCDNNSGGVTLTTLGNNVYNITSFPLLSPTAYTRPWSWDYNLTKAGLGCGGGIPADWNSSSGTRVKIYVTQFPSTFGGSQAVSDIYYDPVTQPDNLSGNASPDTFMHGVGIIQMDYPYSAVNPTNTAYYLASGLAPQGDQGALILAETDLSGMVRGFLNGGLYTAGTSAHITQLPLFQVSSANPANQFVLPTTIPMTWSSPVSSVSGIGSSSLWFRWAGALNQANFYTEQYPGGYSSPATYSLNTYSENVTVVYVPMYCLNTAGVSWFYADDGSQATTAQYPSCNACTYPCSGCATFAPAYHAVTTTNLNWNVSNTTTFPQGDYLFRVEGYRVGYPLHFSYHQLQISINR